MGGSFSLKVGDNNVNIKRSHFPLVPAYSYTAHKSQGKTLKKVMVDLVPPKGMKHMDISFAYVPLSRVRSLNDLTILRHFDSKILKKNINRDCAKMMEDFKKRDLSNIY